MNKEEIQAIYDDIKSAKSKLIIALKANHYRNVCDVTSELNQAVTKLNYALMTLEDKGAE
jgi:hypothetical protein